MSRKPEVLLSCPLCGAGRFTTRGLRQHWCPSKAAGDKKSAPLSGSEWKEAVDAARAEQREDMR